MSEIVNLNRFRKGQKKQAKQRQAEQNRILYGRTKVEKERDAVTKAKDEASLEGHKLEKEGPEEID